eukprot:7504806-Ditylum_brightwellii.AAC.1
MKDTLTISSQSQLPATVAFFCTGIISQSVPTRIRYVYFKTQAKYAVAICCLLYTSPSPRDPKTS